MARAATVMSYKPIEEPGETLYSLNYIYGTIQRYKLIRLTDEISMDEVVKVAKRYCAKHSYRFVFIEPAITIIDPRDYQRTEEEKD